MVTLDEHGRFVRELREGSMLARFFAKVIDAFTTSLVGGLIAVISGIGWTAAIGPLLFLFSDALASPGKWLMRLEAVRMDGSKPGFFGSLSRNATLALPPLGAILMRSGLFETALSPTIEGSIVGCLAVLLLVVECVTLLVAPMSRRWSDQFSGTRVVRR